MRTILWIWILALLLLMTVNVARAEGPTLKDRTQEVVMELNKVAVAIKDKHEDFQYYLDPYVPLDDFKIEVKLYYIGVKWTF